MTTSASCTQRYLEDVREGEELPAVAYPLTVYRMVMAAGTTRDFNPMHHDTEAAQAGGAPEMYASTSFLLGTWERFVRDWIGAEGTILSIRGFRMRSFNLVGDTTWVRGNIRAVRSEGPLTVVDLEVRCENATGVTVGPGVVTVTLPARG